MEKRSVRINGHATSISLEDDFWAELRAIAQTRKIPLSRLIAEIDETRGDANLSSALRVFVLKDAKAAITRYIG